MTEPYDFLIDVRDVLSRGISRHATVCAADVVPDLINAHSRVVLLAETHQAGQLAEVRRNAGVELVFAPYAEYFARFDESILRLVNERFRVRHTHSFAQFIDPRLGQPMSFSATIYDLTRLQFGQLNLLSNAGFSARLGPREFTNMERAVRYMRARLIGAPGHYETLMEEYIRVHVQYVVNAASFVCVPSSTIADDVAGYLHISGEGKIVVQEPTSFPSFFPESHEACQSRISELMIPSRFILFVGTPDWHKRLDLVLDYLTGIDDDDLASDNLSVVVAGDEAGEDLFERLGGRDRDGRAIVRVGNVSDDMLRALYAEAYFTVVPSMNEGYGLPLDEALLSGGRVLVADLPVFRDRVNNSLGRAVAYQPMSQESFHEAVRKVLKSSDREASIPSTRESIVSSLLLSL
jgi:glycosyltransferase involved in cell wall biosynthesis